MAAEDVDSNAKDYAQARIAALMEDSDSDDAAADWKPRLTDIPSSSQEEAIKPVASVDYDLDLEDEHGLAAPSSSAPASADALEDDEDGSAAYARMMQSLKKKPEPLKEPVMETAPGPKKSIGVAAQDSSSEEDLPVKKTIRRTKIAPSSPARSASLQSPRQVTRSPSPGLFVSPTRPPRASKSPSPTRQINTGSDSDDMPINVPGARFQQLVARKRAEREAKEALENAEKQAARRRESEKQKELAKQYKDVYSSELNDGMTEEAQQVLEKNSRPAARKASKRAMEELNRETQRMSRNMQLAHQARVKKRYSTFDFVKDFSGGLPTPQSEMGKANNSSDNEGQFRQATPPSSPPSLKGSQEKLAQPTEENEEDYIIRPGLEADADEEMPDVDNLLLDPVRSASKGKGKAVLSSPSQKAKTVPPPAKQLRKQIRVSVQPKLEDSDDDLEIVVKKPSRFAIFDKLPEKSAHESKSLMGLRALAHMEAPTKPDRNGRIGLSAGQLQAKLAKQMLGQTLANKAERIAELRARGIEFKTEEEIEEDQLFVENSLERARKEAMELGLKEKERAKRNGEDFDENYALPSDDEDEDADFEEEEEEDDLEVELSGSDGEDDADNAIDNPTGLFDDAAEEASEDEKMADEDEEIHEGGLVVDDGLPGVEDEVEEVTVQQNARSRARKRNIVLDDDDEKQAVTATAPETPAALSRGSLHTSPFDAFGFAIPKPELGLTQMFQGTMEALVTQEGMTEDTPAGKSLGFLGDVPLATLPSPGLLVPSSQATPVKQSLIMAETPRLTPQLPTPARFNSQMSPSKFSEVPEPTQDMGFDSFIGTRVEQPYHSTVETIIMPVVESPVVIRKPGKLRRRAQQVAELSDDEGVAPAEAGEHDGEGDFELTTNAFDALFKKTKRPAQPAFDKKTSEAKNMFEDQAEESEDEYAGLGGASDDESDNGIDEETAKMIDEGPIDVKEGELAAFFADKDRADDEKRIDRLYKDIATGALRRKRGGMGAGDGLSDDSDDEVQERQRRKQAEFRKMRQALLLDENVNKLAENHKKIAFLKAIEDREEDEGLDFLDEPEEGAESQLEATQDAQAEPAGVPQATPAPTANIGAKRKLPSEFAVPNMSHRRRPAQIDTFKKPIGPIELRNSISDLLDEPLVPDSQISDQSDDDDEDDSELGRAIRQHRNDRNGSSVLNPVCPSIINRLTNSRQNSMTTDDESQGPSGPMAFHTSTAKTNLFKIPNLLRRATTNLSTTSNTSGTSTPTATTNENAVRMGGSKRSNIHFQAREAERMKKVRDVERRRTEGIRKSVTGKARVSVLGTSLGRKGSGFE